MRSILIWWDGGTCKKGILSAIFFRKIERFKINPKNAA
jgi:hypothetical protein